MSRRRNSGVVEGLARSHELDLDRKVTGDQGAASPNWLPQEESVAGHSGVLFREERSAGKPNSLSYHSGGKVVFGDLSLEYGHVDRTSVFAKQL
jgi:hypothetical protein